MSNPDSSAIVYQLRNSSVFQGKGSIRLVSSLFPAVRDGIINGDDASAIPDGDGYLLLATEGIIPELIKSNPYLAGRCAVLANVNDVYAMGGRPVALVDVIGVTESETVDAICRGISDNAARFGVPVVGGHILRVGSCEATLAVAILGRARRLITSFDAHPGDMLILVTGQKGRWLGDHGFWNCTLEEDDKNLIPNLELLPQAAERGLVEAGKDVSMAGIGGTAVMLAESSGVGLRVYIDRIPKPEGPDLISWMLAFLSYGFLLSVHPSNASALLALFGSRGLWSTCIGSVVPGSDVVLIRGDDQAKLWDWRAEPFTGFGKP